LIFRTSIFGKQKTELTLSTQFGKLEVKRKDF
jgi:hypothetical protein